MGDDGYNLKRCFPHKRKLSGHLIVKDRDLQIHMPVIEDIEPAANLCHAYQNANFKSRTLSFSERLSPTNFQEQEIKVAMAEAETAYDSMMEIRQQLRQAYEELMHTPTH